MAELPKERTAAWRDDKRRAGYRPVTIWLPAEVKGELDTLAYHRHQDIASCLTDAIRALAASQGRTPVIPLDSRQKSAMVQEITDQATEQAVATILTQLTALGIAVHVPTPPAPPATLPPIGPPPPGMKYCQKQHAYPTTKSECPQCVRERKRRYRKRKAEQRAGTLPTL
jgi:hypothetical protein